MYFYTWIGTFYSIQVVDEKLPMNHQITYLLQDIFNLLPDVTNPQFVKSINVNTNDQMLVLYTSSLIRSIIGKRGMPLKRLVYTEGFFNLLVLISHMCH